MKKMKKRESMEVKYGLIAAITAFIAMSFLALLSLQIDCVSAYEESDYPIEVFDNYGRIVKLDYLDDNYDVRYFYFDTTINIARVDVGYGKEVYFYDRNGNLLAEEYLGYPEKNIYYTYYIEGNLGTITKGDVRISFTYDADNRVSGKKTTIISKHKTTIETYTYDIDGNLIQIKYPGKTVNYTYDTGGNLLSEAMNRIVDGEKLKEEASYSYDDAGNILGVSDNTGVQTNYSYESVNYDCEEIRCLDTNCADPENCTTLYDCSSETCVPYECASYDFVDSTCSYDRLKSRDVNNFKVNITYDGEGEITGYCKDTQCYLPLEKYNDDGLLIEDDEYTYAYDKDYQLISSTHKKSKQTVKYEYDSEGNLKKRIYGANDYEEYKYDPLGNVINIHYVYPTGEYESPGTGNVMKNFFMSFLSLITGNAITGNAVAESGEVDYYFTSPGDIDSAYIESEFDQVVSDYEDENGEIPEDEEFSSCIDADYTGVAGESYFNASYVLDNYAYYYDSCKDNFTLSEYYCGFDIGLFKVKKIAKEKLYDCEFGCLGGACLKQVANETTPGNETMPGNETNQTMPPANEQGLIAYYPFDYNARDYSGNENNGIFGNRMPLSVKGYKGKAYDFTNADGIILNGSNVLNGKNYFTIAFYFKTNYTNSSGGFRHIYLGGDYLSMFKISNWGADKIGFLGATGTNYIQDSSLMDNNWHSFILVKNNTNISLYVDGIFRKEKIGSLDINSDSKPIIGSLYFVLMGNYSYEGNFKGAIDEFKIYDIALTAEEINFAYGRYASLPEEPGALNKV
jgi:YD repeat-containing protein